MIQKALNSLFKKDDCVIVHGFYGAGNLGDEAILSATLSQISSLKQAQPIVFGRNPARVRATHQVFSVNPDAIYNMTGYLHLPKASVYILGGGGLLKDYGKSSHNVEVWLRWLTRAKSLGLKTMLWSVGVENLRFDKSKKLIQTALETVDAITVRDPNSKQRLEQVGLQNPVIVTADPAILLAEKQSKRRVLRKNPRIVVCLRHWFKYDMSSVPDPAANEKMLDSIAMVLDYAVNTLDAKIELVPFRTTSNDDDRKILESLFSRMIKKDSVVIHNEVPQLDEAINIFSDTDIVFSMRLHAAIIATSLGVPTIALSYMPKVRDYMNLINQESFCFDIEEVDKKCLMEGFEKILNTYEELSEQLVITRSTLSEKLQDNVSILTKLVSK